MNWTAIDFDWNQVRAFLATVEEGSLSAAARVLGQTQPTLGRQIAALEADLGVTLFERTGRRLIPTPTAREMASHVRAMGDAAARVSLIASGQSREIAGPVRITASEGYSVGILPAFLARMRRLHPRLVIEIVATNTLSDLLTREADIAVRNADPTDPDLIARRVRTDTGGLFATPEIIRAHGPFLGKADLSGAPFVGFEVDAPLIAVMAEHGVTLTPDQIVARSGSHPVHWELTRAGLGIGLHSVGIGARSPGVVQVLPGEVSIDFPVWLVAPRELRTSRRVRAVYDALADYLARWPEPAESGNSALDGPSASA